MTDAVTDTDLPAPPREPSRPARNWRPLAVLVAAQLLAGVLAGLIWRAWAPGTVSYLLSGGDGKPAFVVPQESESQIAGDGRFVLMSIGLGMVFGLVAWRLRALRGPVVLAALACAGLLSSVLARLVGESLSSGAAAAKVNSAFTPQLSLHSLPALAIQAFFGVLVYTALAGLSADPELADRRTSRTADPDLADRRTADPDLADRRTSDPGLADPRETSPTADPDLAGR